MVSASEIIVDVLCVVGAIDEGGGRNDSDVIGVRSLSAPLGPEFIEVVGVVLLEFDCGEDANADEALVLIALVSNAVGDVEVDREGEIVVGLLMPLVLNDNVGGVLLAEIGLAVAIAIDSVGPIGPVRIEVIIDGV